jgi:hypothetical protein
MHVGNPIQHYYPSRCIVDLFNFLIKRLNIKTQGNINVLHFSNTDSEVIKMQHNTQPSNSHKKYKLGQQNMVP